MTFLKQIIETEKESKIMIEIASKRQKDEIDRIKQLIEKETNDTKQSVKIKIEEIEEERKKSVNQLKEDNLIKKESIKKNIEDSYQIKTSDIINKLFKEIVGI